MKPIRKTNKAHTYFKGNFYLRDNSTTNWAHPIDFPTVFVAYSQDIRSGNWQSCTSINTPKYVIDNYFDGKKGGLIHFWDSVSALEHITWEDVKKDKEKVLSLINAANNQLLKLKELN